MGLATPPLDWFVGAWLGQVLLLLGLRDASPWRGAWRGWVFGVTANLIVLRFVPATIARFTSLPWPLAVLALVLLAMLQALPWGGVGLMTVFLRPRLGVVAFAVAVWGSLFVPMVFPWSVAGGLSALVPLVQLADVVGERGVSALLAVSAAFLAEAARSRAPRRAVRWVTGSLLVPALMGAEGIVRIRTIDQARSTAHSARVGLVQPGTEARMRWDPQEADRILARLTRLTESAEARGADLVVWPEAAFPFPMRAGARTDLFGRHAVLQPGVHGPVLAGLIMVTPEGSYNSAALVHSGQIDPAYHKMHLLAFGETIPLAPVLPVLRRVFARGEGMIPGDHQVLLRTNDIRAAVLNCYEDTLPEAGREAAAVQPNLLVNLTNDAWFEGTEEGALHLRLAAMRSVELRRDLVRAVNLGPTSWVDATGRVRARYDQGIPTALAVQPALLELPPTLYARFGDTTGAALLTLLAAAHALGRRLGGDRPPDTTAEAHTVTG